MSEQGIVHEASRWCYSGLWGVLTEYFKTPKEPPHLPSMDGEVIEYLNPSIEWLNYQKFFFWIGLTIMDVIFTGVWIAIAYWWPLLGVLITPLALAIIVLPDIVAYIAIHLRYDTTWYALSDRSMRLRRGIWTIHETTITFENIQNIQLHQGPIQRWFGFANLLVKTAGGGGHEAGAVLGAHVGILEGLNNAAEIRERILKHCQRNQTAGLGDEVEREHMHVIEDEHRIAVSTNRSAMIETLKQIRDYTRVIASDAH